MDVLITISYKIYTKERLIGHRTLISEKTRTRCPAALPAPNRPKQREPGSHREAYIDAEETTAVAAAVREIWDKRTGGGWVFQEKEKISRIKAKARSDSPRETMSNYEEAVPIAGAVAALAAVHVGASGLGRDRRPV